MIRHMLSYGGTLLLVGATMVLMPGTSLAQRGGGGHGGGGGHFGSGGAHFSGGNFGGSHFSGGHYGGGRVGLMGWSQGGGVVLLSINDKSIGRPAGLAQDFSAAVSFYPGSCSEKLQSKPFTEVEPANWTTKVPLLTLMGEADTWTLFPPCEAFLTAAKARGNPVELKSYPLAVHAFDAPNLSRHELPQYRTGDGPIPVIATDREARFDAFVRVLEFLKSHLETN